MKLHANAGLSPIGRRLVVDRVERGGQTVQAVSESLGISPRTASKWLARWRAEGELGLLDRSSAPSVVANRTDERTIEAIAALRRLRFTGPEIAEMLGMPLSTVSGILTRIGMGRLGRLGLEPAERYERAVAGELIHIDVKKLGRIHGGAGKRITGRKRNPSRTRLDKTAGFSRQIVGWDYVHVAIDDATRLAYAEVLPDEKGGDGDRVPPPGHRVLRQLRHDRSRAADRQRLGLPLSGSRDRLPRQRHQAPAHAASPTADQRQGVCLKITGPSEVAARLPAPVGLTQAKACRRSRFLPSRRGAESPVSWPAFDLSTGGLRAGRRR